MDCGYALEPPRRGGSNAYPQSMFLSRNKKHHVYPCKPQFYYIKVGFKGSELYRYVFVMLRLAHIPTVRLFDVVAHLSCSMKYFCKKLQP